MHTMIAAHVYFDVTPEEEAAIDVAYYRQQTDDKIVIGTDVEYAPLAAKEVPPYTPSSGKTVAEVWEEIKRIRDERLQQAGYKVGTNWFQSDTFSRSQQLGLARKADRVEAAGGNMDTPFPGPGPGGFLFWKTMDSSFVPMTPNLAQAIFDAVAESDSALFVYAEFLHGQAAAAADPGTIDLNNGWPEAFQDTHAASLA